MKVNQNLFPHLPDRISGLADLAGSIEHSRGKSPHHDLLSAVENLLDELHLPRRFSQKGISRDRYDAAIEKTIPAALGAFATKTSPVSVTEEMMRTILEEAY